MVGIAPARASEVRRLGNTQAITRCGEPLQLHEPMQLQSWVGIFAQHHTERRAMAGPRAFDGLCDDEGVPLICPTCQVLPKASSPATACYFAWGCFRYFWLGATATRHGCENPACSRAHELGLYCGVKWRIRHDSNVRSLPL